MEKMIMKSEYKVAIELIRCVNGKSVDMSVLREADWEAVLAFCSRQGVAGVCWDALEKLYSQGAFEEGLPAMEQGLKLKWMSSVLGYEKTFAKYGRVIGGLSAFYAENNIRMLLLKGYGLALNYPKPDHRPCGDIDIWLYGKLKEGDRLLQQKKGICVKDDHHHHTVFYVNGVMVENHYDFLNVYAHLSNRRVEKRLQEMMALDEGGQLNVNGSRVYVPSADFNALFLLRHSASHFAAEEILLRHLLDWGYFVKAHSSEIDWNGLYAFSKELNMHKFLSCVNYICVEYLGFDAVAFPSFDVEQSIVSRVFDEIILPGFREKEPSSGFFRTQSFKFRRWWHNRWKHRLVYNEGLITTLLVLLKSHMMNPSKTVH